MRRWFWLLATLGMFGAYGFPQEADAAQLKKLRLTFFVGDTIGLEAREFRFLFGPAEEVDDPFLPNTSNVSMEPGMTVNLEASSQVMGWGSVQVEYTCAVTETGTSI